MVTYYDEVEIEDCAWDPIAKVFHFPCPCGDRFEISKGQLRDGEEIATCPSCSLIIRVIYDYLDWEDYVTSDEEDADDSEDEAVETKEGQKPSISQSLSLQAHGMQKAQNEGDEQPSPGSRPHTPPGRPAISPDAPAALAVSSLNIAPTPPDSALGTGQIIDAIVDLRVTTDER